MVIDEGVLFRTSETAFLQTKRKLLDDCDLWCIVSMPPGVFSQAGADVKTNLLFFTKGRPTERIWYYDLKAVNPHRVVEQDTRTPEELLDEIERQQAVIAEAIAELREL